MAKRRKPALSDSCDLVLAGGKERWWCCQWWDSASCWWEFKQKSKRPPHPALCLSLIPVLAFLLFPFGPHPAVVGGCSLLGAQGSFSVVL